jgi:hypothetical protein
MNKRAERNIVVLLFLFVIVIFSFADRDSKKIKRLYTETQETVQKMASLKNIPLTKN